MRNQSNQQGGRFTNLRKGVWEETKFPLAVSLILGVITCAMVGLALGKAGIPLLLTIGASALVIPVLIGTISHYLESHNGL